MEVPRGVDIQRPLRGHDVGAGIGCLKRALLHQHISSDQVQGPVQSIGRWKGLTGQVALRCLDKVLDQTFLRHPLGQVGMTGGLTHAEHAVAFLFDHQTYRAFNILGGS